MRKYVIAACAGAFLFLFLLGAWAYLRGVLHFAVDIKLPLTLSRALPEPNLDWNSLSDRWAWLTFAAVFLDGGISTALAGAAAGVCTVLAWNASIDWSIKRDRLKQAEMLAQNEAQ
jgi:hypothetical protein